MSKVIVFNSDSKLDKAAVGVMASVLKEEDYLLTQWLQEATMELVEEGEHTRLGMTLEELHGELWKRVELVQSWAE